jgi:hypothetical protein
VLKREVDRLLPSPSTDHKTELPAMAD